jgi:hypothetical protein
MPNIEQSLNMHSRFWASHMRRSNPNAGFGEIDLKEYARRAISGDNPIKIARIVQIASAGCTNLELSQKLMGVVDRLIVCDDEYIGTIDGLECAYEHGKFFSEMGQVRRSW